jgi:hypothetical protein
MNQTTDVDGIMHMARGRDATQPKMDAGDNGVGLYIVNLPSFGPSSEFHSSSEMSDNAFNRSAIVKEIREALSRNIPALVTNYFSDFPPVSFDEEGIRALRGSLDCTVTWQGQ